MMPRHPDGRIDVAVVAILTVVMALALALVVHAGQRTQRYHDANPSTGTSIPLDS